MLAQSPGNRPAVVDVLTDIRFFEAKKNDEIADIEEALRLDDNVPQSDAENSLHRFGKRAKTFGTRRTSSRRRPLSNSSSTTGTGICAWATRLMRS